MSTDLVFPHWPRFLRRSWVPPCPECGKVHAQEVERSTWGSRLWISDISFHCMLAAAVRTFKSGGSPDFVMIPPTPFYFEEFDISEAISRQFSGRVFFRESAENQRSPQWIRRFSCGCRYSESSGAWFAILEECDAHLDDEHHQGDPGASWLGEYPPWEATS